MSEKDYTSIEVAVQINSSMETMALYKEFKEQGLEYIQDRGGPLLTIGHVDGRPICVAPLIHVIGGVKVGYFEATSELVDWKMIEEWIRSVTRPGIDIVADPINLLSNINSRRWMTEQAKKEPTFTVPIEPTATE